MQPSLPGEFQTNETSCLKKLKDMCQQLRVLAAPVEDLGLIPSTHMVAHNHLQF